MTSEPAPVLPQGRRRRRSPVLVAMAIGLGSGLLLAAPLADLIRSTVAKGGGAAPNPFTAWSLGLGDTDLLVLGTDQGGGNTDVITTVRVEGGVTSVTQIPRDTYVEAERFGPVKINALYALGGINTVKREIAQRTGRPIQHHVVVNLSSIRRMADLLGGIEVTVPKRMYYVDHSQGLYIDLKPGPQLLKGRDLEGFLRFRYDELGDIGRLERQQLALQALFHKLTRPDQLVRLPALLVAAGKEVKTDLGPMELGGLITSMGTTQLKTRRLGGRPFYQGGISYWDAEWPTPAASNGEGSSTAERYVF